MQDNDQLMETLKKIYEQLPDAPRQGFFACSDFLFKNSNAPSGYYQVKAANGSAIEIFCDMHGGDPLWRRRLNEGGSPQHD